MHAHLHRYACISVLDFGLGGQARPGSLSETPHEDPPDDHPAIGKSRGTGLPERSCWSSRLFSGTRSSFLSSTSPSKKVIMLRLSSSTYPLWPMIFCPGSSVLHTRYHSNHRIKKTQFVIRWRCDYPCMRAHGKPERYSAY